MFEFLNALGGLFGSPGGAAPAPQQQTSPAMGQFLSFLPNLGQPAPVSQSSSWQRDHSVPMDMTQAVMAPFAEQPARAPALAAVQSAPAAAASGMTAPAMRDYISRVPQTPDAPATPELPDVQAFEFDDSLEEAAPAPPPVARTSVPPSKLGTPPGKQVPDFAKATRLDTAPRLIRSDPMTTDKDLGSVSAKYESGGRGVGFISSGKGDPGGKSYGVHQLSGAYSMGAFLRSAEGAAYRAAFAGLKPTTDAFNRVYKAIAAKDPAGFAKAQRAFYTRTHFEPLRRTAEKLGFNVANRAVQEALFSMSVQHGKAAKIVSRAAWAAKADVREQVNALYAARSNYVAKLGTLPARTKRSVLNRYLNERRDALRFL